jgi:hypothetical protein
MSSDKKSRFQINLTSASLGDQDQEISKVQGYLTRYGYLTTTLSPNTLDAPTSEALRSFQRVFGLEATGELDAATTEALELPRCGTPDLGLIEGTEGGVSASFVLRGCAYGKNRFTYRFVNGTGDITGTQERSAVRNAFNTWANALCGITFEERTSGVVDFEVGWFTGSHGDGNAFDGVGNTLAHGFYPPPCGGSHAGECHFDDAETWSLTGSGGTFDLETVALHEIGHLLGLEHSSVSGSVMFPSYGGVRRALTQDDLDGIRRLYPFVCRRGDSGSQAGFVAEIAAARHNQSQVVTAVRTQAGDLKLIAWRVAAGGGISRTGDSSNQAGRATSIDIARNTTGNRFVTACRTSSGRLKLISWSVNSSGSSINRSGDSGSQAGTASLIRIVAVAADRFVVACRTSSGNLKLIGWRLNSNGSLTRLTDSANQAGTVRDLALVALSGNRVVTAVRTDGGDLKLISWSVGDSSISRLGDSGSQAGSARTIRATVDSFSHVITAVKASNDDLKLISWQITGSGNVNRLGDSGSQAGRTRGHDISAADGRVVTGVRAADDHLKVIVWQSDNNGAISRVGDSANLAGTASLITQCEELAGAPPITTCVRTTTSSLKLISWSTS